MKKILFTLACAALLLPAYGTSGRHENPLLQPSSLPFHAPPFDQIQDADYQPAIDQGMKEHLAEIEAIANNPDPATFDNTIVAMEKSGALLTRATKIFFNLSQSNTDPALEKVEQIESPRLAEHSDAVYLNRKLFARVQALYDSRDKLDLDPVSKHLLERTYLNFVRAGAKLDDGQQARLRELNKQEAALGTEFHKRLLSATDKAAVIVSDRKALDGLGADDVAAAAEAARDRHLTGKWILEFQNTTQQPFLSSLQNRALRERIMAASEARCDKAGPNDTRAIICKLAAVRAEKAQLLGYATAADYLIGDQMAKTGAAAEKALTDLVPAATAKARREAADIQKLMGSQTLTPADWEYYTEKIRKARYSVDDAQVKPYFELNHVLFDGVFFAANKLYGLTFKERHDLPVYQKDVRVFEVHDADGKPLALFYADYYQRPNKSGGAWMDSFVDQNGLTGDLPVIVNVTNFSKPPPGHPTLLTFEDVTTMFHEFGHALHGMLSNVKYPSISCTNVPRDFVEFPSQFNEHWASDPTVMASYAHHYKTGAPMPPALIARIKAAKTFNEGYETTEYLAAALLDLAWHTTKAPVTDVNAFEAQALKGFQIDLPQVPPRYHSTYFAHIWDGGYDAGYYAYLWSEILDDDCWYWFEQHGGLTRENGQRFRDMILSRGESDDVANLFRNFYGSDPVVEPLLIERGLK